MAKTTISGLGPIRIFDMETGKLILEGKLTELTYKDETGHWRVRVNEPKKCPHCGADLK